MGVTKTLTPTRKIPRQAGVFRMLRRKGHYTCPSCRVKRPHWMGYIGEWCNSQTYEYVCLRCGQASRDTKDSSPLYHTIRVAVNTPAEAGKVRRVLQGHGNIWPCVEIMQPDGSVHLQWGSYQKGPIDAITAALRAAGFRATREET